MWVNHAKFEDNGACGLVLKPPLMNETTRFDPVNNPKFYQKYFPIRFFRQLWCLVCLSLILYL